MIKAAFFDFDGTLYSHISKSIPESTIEAIQILRKSGVQCILATGRPKEELESLIGRTMEFDGFILHSGQLCYDYQFKKYFSMPISGAVKKSILALFGKKEIPIQLCEEKCGYINFLNRRVERVLGDISTGVPPLGEYTGNEFYVATAYVDEKDIPRLKALSGGAKVTRWHQNGCDLLPPDGGKHVGVKAYMEKYGVLRNEIMAFGDGNNDVEMLRLAGFGVAMGNASLSAKESADYITTDIDENGILNAVEHFRRMM